MVVRPNVDADSAVETSSLCGQSGQKAFFIEGRRPGFFPLSELEQRHANQAAQYVAVLQTTFIFGERPSGGLVKIPLGPFIRRKVVL